MLLICALLLVFFSTAQSQFPPNGNDAKTTSLSGGFATDGDSKINAVAIELLTVGLLGGYAERKVKQFNDRIYLNKFLRSYWLGTRYYSLDNHYFLDTRDTCAYRMDSTERVGLEYEDGALIHDIIYQCQRFAEYCCGLTCCKNSDRRAALAAERAKNGVSGVVAPLFLMIIVKILL